MNNSEKSYMRAVSPFMFYDVDKDVRTVPPTPKMYGQYLQNRKKRRRK